MSFVASYRLQLRDGVTFADAAARLDHIAGLGVSHLYLAPILTAAPGSTHGYDVTHPGEVDPALGGRNEFAALSRAAQERGLQVILDIVPNHMAFGLDTPWLVDVLRHGTDSDHAAVFDIDWDAGPLALPWLTEPLGDAAEAGEVSVEDGALRVGGLAIPLRPGSWDAEGALGRDAATALEEKQAWRLLPWQMERDSITHRRFFSVTGLIGVRVEDEAVFDRIHGEVLSLIEDGLVHGLRVDHVDGLVDPEGYLKRLAGRTDVPVWVEKILVTGEDLPDWPVAGTTGYEAATAIARALTDADGLREIDGLWRGVSGIEGDFHGFVEEAKREVLVDELAAELRQLRGLAEAAAAASGRIVGPEQLREAITQLLVAFPRYRSYIVTDASETDADLWRGSAERAATHVRDAGVIDWMADTIIGADTPEARRLAIRMQQVTGALLAKAHEDTAGFRFNRYLPANEVGADPDLPVAGAKEIQAVWQSRDPRAITLGSSHDTKRSEDARARLIAASHAPAAFSALWAEAGTLPGSEALDPNRRFYAMQAALAIWGEPEAAERVANHMVKALREGKEVSYWTAPDEDREARMGDWTRALLAHWDERQPDALLRLVSLGAALSLREVAMRCLVPGMPDIYQGGEKLILQLTDPDNRRAVDWSDPDPETPSARKASLLAACLDLRRQEPDLFRNGDCSWDGRTLIRRHGGRQVVLAMGVGPDDDSIWAVDGPLPFTIRVQAV